MLSYVAYGLVIRSEWPLPELAPSSSQAPADVVVRRGQAPRLNFATRVTGPCIYATRDEACLLWDDVGAFLIREGRDIVVDPVSTLDEPALRMVLLGPALAVALHQRGQFVLHASAVDVHGSAVAFSGEKGRGKSTLAAAFYAHGRAIVADDMIAIRFEQKRPEIFPGYSQLRLWPDALSALGKRPETLPKLHPRIEKRGFVAEDKFSTSALPLQRVYLLKESSAPAIDVLRPQQAFFELLQHSCCKLEIPATGRDKHFFQCARLANSGIVRRLSLPRSFQVVPEVVQLVEADVTGALGAPLEKLADARCAIER